MSRTLVAVCFVSLLLAPAELLAQKKALSSSFTFALKVSGVGDPTGGAFFKAVEGLKSETEVVEYTEGGENGITRKIAGKTKYSNIVLKRGLIADTSVATWRKLVEDGQSQQARRNGVIVLYDNANREVARWSIINAWPNGIAIETDPDSGDPLEVLTLAVEASHRQ
jgi:phage tail-like protein